MPSRPLGDLPGQTFTITIPGAPTASATCPACRHAFETPSRPARVNVTINRGLNGTLQETFVEGASPAACGTVNALCRVLSCALQAGVPVEDLARMMRGQADGGSPVPWPGGGLVVSLPDALARLLEATAKADPDKPVGLGDASQP